MKQDIFEDKYYQQQPKKTWQDMNTADQIKKGQFYSERYRALKSEMEVREEAWNELEKLYKCDREEIEGAPNSFIPLIAPIVNGQIASMAENNISADVKGKGYSDQKFAKVAQIVIDLILKENKIKQRIKTPVKRYLLFGTGIIALDYDPDAMDGFGLPVIRTPQLTKVLVDGNIKDIADYQQAEYIIEEIGYKSIMWAREEYGDDAADYLIANNNEPDFDAEISDDEKFSFKLLRIWHRNNKDRNLQLLEMDDTGFVLRESDPDEPYYKYVYNKYPYFIFGMYQEEGEFHRFGDGKLLKFMQETLNKLYDEVVTACKFASQGRTYIDPAAQCDPDQFDQDPSHPVIAKNPNQNIKVERGAGIDNVIERLIANLVQEAQRVSRFSSLMAGNDTGRQITATEAGIQTQQGNTGIDDKKSDVSDALSDLCSYALGMCMELWSAGQALRVSEDREEFEWVDAKQLANIPIEVPVDDAFTESWTANNPDKEVPQYMQLETEEGAQTKTVSLDMNISIGEGIMKNKTSLYNIILSLAQMQLLDETTGQPKGIISYQKTKQLIEDLLGIPLGDDEVQPIPQQQGIPQQGIQQAPQVAGNPMIEGASAGGKMNPNAFTGGSMV